MSDLYSFIPWVSFVAGLGGSLHCVGMCGGLVASCSNSKSGTYTYQIGRLIGYTLLGLVAGSIGHILGIQFSSNGPSSWASVITSVMMGSILIYWGIKNFTGSNIDIPIPKVFKRIQMNLWQKALNKLSGGSKGLAIGFLSIFLPCGLLYGAVISIASFQSPLVGAFSMMTFWLGTLPALATSGEIFKRIFLPLKSKFPKMSSISLVLIGILTISWRLYALSTSSPVEACH